MPSFRHKLGTTYYLRRGRARRSHAPLIALHGGPGGSHYLQRRLLDLSNDRPVVVYDQLGGGRSKAKSKHPKWSIALFVNELKALADHLGFETFHLAGSSWGCTLALEYYLRTRDRRIRSLIFSSPMFSAPIWMKDARILLKKLPKKHQKVIRMCESVGATDSKVYKDAEMEFFRRFVFRGDWSAPNMKRSMKNFNPAIYNYMWGSSEFNATGTLKNYDRIKDLKKIRVPTYLMCGQYDEATPKSCRSFQQRIPDAKFTVLKGCSHVSTEERPRYVLGFYRRWLQEVDAAAAQSK